MANKRDLAKILNQANKAPRDSFGGWKPPDKSKITFKVTKATTKENTKKQLTFTLMLTITKGEFEGKVARCYLAVNEEHEFITQRLIDNFGVLGVDISTIVENPQLACEMVVGKTGVAAVTHGGNDPNDPIVNFDFEARRAPKGSGPKRRKAAKVEDSADYADDEDEEETPAPKKRAAKKTAKKAATKKATRRKPKPEPEPWKDEDEDEWEDDDEDDVFDPDEEDDDDDDEWDDEEDDDEWEDDEE